MAKQYSIRTSATAAELRGAFGKLFLTRPSLKERFTLSKAAQLRNQQIWEAVSVADADIAARLVRGGMREAIASGRSGPGSQIGTVIAMKVHEDGSDRIGVLWLVNYPTWLGMNQMGDVLKAYAKGIAKELSITGSEVQVSKG